MQRLWQSIVRVFAALSPARRRLAVVAAIFFSLCVLTFLTSKPSQMMIRKAAVGSKTIVNENLPVPTPETETFATGNHDAHIEEPLATDHLQLRAILPGTPNDPRIAFSAELAVVTKDFTHARSSMEDILERHRGYAARLRMVGHPNSSTLSATLKVPASEYPSTLADLKSIGNVEQDEEAADEIVQQRGDIEARLQNAQNNVRRLELLIKENSEKSIDVDYVQRQLVALRAEIAQMELQRHSFDNRVVFSNIRFSLREEHEAPVESISAQLRNAIGTGLSDAAHSLSALLIVLVSYGPSFVLWAAVLFFPARYLWRRASVPLARETA